MQEASRYRAHQQEAKKAAQRKIAQQRQQKNAYAYQPEQRPVFNIFSIFQ